MGSVCGGFAYDRLNKIGLFVTVMTVMGITAIAVPWCSHIAAMLIVHVGFGCIEQALIGKVAFYNFITSRLIIIFQTTYSIFK